MELTIWEKALGDAIRSAEMLVRKLKALKSLGGAEEKLAGSVSAAKLSEGVTLRVRSLPGHTGHPLAREHLRSAIREAVPVELGFTEQGWFCLRMPMLLPRKEKSSRSYLRGFLYPALEEFTAELEMFGIQDKNGRYLWVGWGYMACLASVPNHAPPGQACDSCVPTKSDAG